MTITILIINKRSVSENHVKFTVLCLLDVFHQSIYSFYKLDFFLLLSLDWDFSNKNTPLTVNWVATHKLRIQGQGTNSLGDLQCPQRSYKYSAIVNKLKEEYSCLIYSYHSFITQLLNKTHCVLWLLTCLIWKIKGFCDKFIFFKSKRQRETYEKLK